MPLKKFKFHTKPDVRLVIMCNTVFKIKLTCQRKSESHSLRDLCKTSNCQSELEKAVCAILYTDKQEPILTESFVIYPYKKKWETANKLKFEHKGKVLKANSSMYTLYVEPRKKTDTKDTLINQVDNTVSDYCQKNRHDVESQNLKEQLRMQEMAKPSQTCCKSMPAGTFGQQFWEFKSIGFKKEAEEPYNPMGLFNSIKRFLRGT